MRIKLLSRGYKIGEAIRYYSYENYYLMATRYFICIMFLGEELNKQYAFVLILKICML